MFYKPDRLIFQILWKIFDQTDKFSFSLPFSNDYLLNFGIFWSAIGLKSVFFFIGCAVLGIRNFSVTLCWCMSTACADLIKARICQASEIDERSSCCCLHHPWLYMLLICKFSHILFMETVGSNVYGEDSYIFYLIYPLLIAFICSIA